MWTPERLEALTKRLGFALPDEIWNLSMVGCRLLVAPETVQETTSGGIVKPRSAIERQKLEMGSGYIIAAGPAAGKWPELGPAGALDLKIVGRLEGLKVIYRAFAGVNIKTTQDDDEFVGGKYELVVLSDRDVLAWRPGV
jgi:co-chaperonin GroES (HSP10)